MKEIPDPQVIYDCRSGQAVAFPTDRRVELRFVTTNGSLIAIGLTGRVLAQVRDKIDELIEHSPEIANWRGERPH
jgi:hypothetical protein